MGGVTDRDSAANRRVRGIPLSWGADWRFWSRVRRLSVGARRGLVACFRARTRGSGSSRYLRQRAAGTRPGIGIRRL